MKKTIILFLLLFSNFYFSQTIEDEVSEKACQCVQQKLEKDKTILKNEISNCISQSLDDVLKRISSQMRDDVNRAYIWGKSAKFPGQEVSFKFLVFDEMEVYFGR